MTEGAKWRPGAKSAAERRHNSAQSSLEAACPCGKGSLRRTAKGGNCGESPVRSPSNPKVATGNEQFLEFLGRFIQCEDLDSREKALLGLMGEKEALHNAEKTQLYGELQALEEVIARLNAEIAVKGKMAEALGEEITTAGEERERLIGELRNFDDLVRELEAEIQDLRRADSEKEEKISNLEREADCLESTAERELSELRMRLCDVVAKHSDSEQRQARERARLEEELTQLQTANSQLRAAWRQSECETRQLKENATELTKTAEQWRNKAQLLALGADRTKEEMRRETDELFTKLTAEKAELKKKLDELMTDVEVSDTEPTLMDELRLVEDQGNDRMSGEDGRRAADTAPGFDFETDSSEKPECAQWCLGSESQSAELASLRSELSALQSASCTQNRQSQDELERAQQQVCEVKVLYADALTAHEAVLHTVTCAARSLPAKYQRQLFACLSKTRV